jgi:hypothetical protein
MKWWLSLHWHELNFETYIEKCYLKLNLITDCKVTRTLFFLQHVAVYKAIFRDRKLWNTGRFIMFSMITNIYNEKTKGHTLMELFTATGKQKKFLFTTRDVRCVPLGTDQCSSEEYRCTHVDACVARTWISYRCVLCDPWCTHRTPLVVKKTVSVFLWVWTIPLR